MGVVAGRDEERLGYKLHETIAYRANNNIQFFNSKPVDSHRLPRPDHRVCWNWFARLFYSGD
jgi:hypothetical protein